MSSDSFPREVVNALLRADLPSFGIACVTALAGICALLLARLRSRDRLLVWVGLFSVLYAIRLFIENELVRDAFNAPGSGFLPWARCVTYAINIPYALFACELLGRGWKKTIVIWLWLSVGFAIIAIPTAFSVHQGDWTGRINNALVVSGTLLVLMHVLIARRNGLMLAASLLWPLLVFCVFVMLENAGARPGGINMEPLGFLVLLAGLASTGARRALATERKLIEVEQELATARRIQRSIIPLSPPNIPSVHLATRYEPMSSVAGDFYDFLKLNDHILTILVADVSGHGVPAALIASVLKVCFAAQREHGNDPARILAGLNLMLRDSLGGQYVTAACAAIDTEARVITYAGAGHPPSLLLSRNSRKTGSLLSTPPDEFASSFTDWRRTSAPFALGTDRDEIIHLAENGLFIGPFPNASYTNMTVHFHAGDKLLLYTDGIVEASGPDGKEFGRARLEQLLVSAANKTPTEFIETLFQEISNGAQQDDLTLVLAQFY